MFSSTQHLRVTLVPFYVRLLPATVDNDKRITSYFGFIENE
jgi:hypothetical protein